LHSPLPSFVCNHSETRSFLFAFLPLLLASSDTSITNLVSASSEQLMPLLR
jgi:hypothetical protein